MAHKEQNGH